MGLMNNILSKTGLGALAVGVALVLSPMKVDAATVTPGLGNPVEGGGTTNTIGIGNVFTMEIAGDYPDAAAGSFVWSFTANERLIALETNSLNPNNGFAGAKVEWNSASDGSGTVFGSISGSALTSGDALVTEFALNEEKFLIASWTSVTAKGSNFDLRVDATPIPLPAGGLLLLTALGGVAALRRKRKAA